MFRDSVDPDFMAAVASAWPHPFTDGVDGSAEPTLIDVGDGHFVRALEPPSTAGWRP